MRCHTRAPFAYSLMALSIRTLTKQRHNTPDIACRTARRWLAVPVEERFGGQDHAVQAEAALRGLLVDERLLDGMRTLGCAETFKRGDPGVADRAYARDARPDRLAVGNNCACTALIQPAAELGPTELKVVGQDA